MASKSKSSKSSQATGAKKAHSNTNNSEQDNTKSAADPQQAAEWAKQVVEHLVEAQKQWIEITQQQNALIVKAIQESMAFYRTAPTPALGDWARQGIEGFVEAQKRWAEVAWQQSRQVFDSMRENVNFDPANVLR